MILGKNYWCADSPGLQVCKSASLQVCKSASLQVCKSAGLQVCRSASLQVCKSAGLQVCRSASLQVCRSASLQVCKSAVCKCRTPYCNSLFYGLPKHHIIFTVKIATDVACVQRRYPCNTSGFRRQ